MNRARVLLLAASFVSLPAHAFGIGDLMSIGIRAGGEILGAAIDKGVDAVKESLRDPEAEAREKAEKERQLAERMQQQIDEIEAMPNLRPIERERLVLQLKKSWQMAKEMQALVERAEAQQKAERDKLLSFGGIAGSIGRAAMSSPSMVMAQANMMVHDPVWRAQQRAYNEAVFREANAQVAAGIPQAKAQLALAQADLLQKTGQPQADAQAALAIAETQTQQRQAEGERIADATGETAPPAPNAADKPESGTAMDAGTPPAPAAAAPIEAPVDAFSPDQGKALYVEFVDSPTETRRLREWLASRGHRLAETREEADIVYLVEGEFAIPESKLHEGLAKSFGALLENPGQAIDSPAKKTMGSIGLGLSRLMLAAAGAQAPQVQGYKQEALIVIARQPKGGKETRASAIETAQGEAIEAVRLAKAAKEALYRDLGL